MARDCRRCKHYVVTDSRSNWNSQEPTLIYSCNNMECVYDPDLVRMLNEINNLPKYAARFKNGDMSIQVDLGDVMAIVRKYMEQQGEYTKEQNNE